MIRALQEQEECSPSFASGGARPRRRRQAGSTEAADELTLQLKWVTQAQFAGYHVAKEKGSYDEAAGIVLEHDESGVQTQKHQRRMMGAVNELVGGAQGIGLLDPADYQRTVDVLLARGSDPVITATPEGAWTHKVWEAIQ